ncbi:MAG: 50S ribosomal protein L25/general stress protein Ctc [Cyclobacteriaceae bacterium]
MKTVEIIGYKRANLGKKEAKRLRAEGFVPGVVYGGENGEQLHFYAPVILFRPLVYTAEAHMVDLNIEGEHKRCILQDIQFHPVNEMIIHADFLELQEKKPVKMDIPVHLLGTAPGVGKGGNLMFKRRRLRLKALPKDMPEFIEVDISKLDFGKAIKVGEVKVPNAEILDSPLASIAVIEIPRALRGRTVADEETEGAELEAEAASEE